MSTFFYHFEDDFRISVRTPLEDPLIPDFSCREQISEWAKPYILNICAVNQAIVIAFGIFSESVGVTTVPLPASPDEAGFLWPDNIRSFLKALEAPSFCVIIPHVSRRNSIPSRMELCIGIALQTYFPDAFLELVIADNLASHFRFLKLDEWLPQSSCYGDSEELYHECVGQKIEQLEAELKSANRINKLKVDANISMRLARKLNSVNICTVSKLRKVGAVKAWSIMKRSGLQTSERDLFALEAAIRGVPITKLTAEDKKELKSKLN